MPPQDFLSAQTLQALAPIADIVADIDADEPTAASAAKRWRRIGYTAIGQLRLPVSLPTTPDVLCYAVLPDLTLAQGAEVMLRTVPAHRLHEVIPAWRRLATAVDAAAHAAANCSRHDWSANIGSRRLTVAYDGGAIPASSSIRRAIQLAGRLDDAGQHQLPEHLVAVRGPPEPEHLVGQRQGIAQMAHPRRHDRQRPTQAPWQARPPPDPDRVPDRQPDAAGPPPSTPPGRHHRAANRFARYPAAHTATNARSAPPAHPTRSAPCARTRPPTHPTDPDLVRRFTHDQPRTRWSTGHA
jgi:hypothetical protein